MKTINSLFLFEGFDEKNANKQTITVSCELWTVEEMLDTDSRKLFSRPTNRIIQRVQVLLKPDSNIQPTQKKLFYVGLHLNNVVLNFTEFKNNTLKFMNFTEF